MNDLVLSIQAVDNALNVPAKGLVVFNQPDLNELVFWFDHLPHVKTEKSILLMTDIEMELSAYLARGDPFLVTTTCYKCTIIPSSISRDSTYSTN